MSLQSQLSTRCNALFSEPKLKIVEVSDQPYRLPKPLPLPFYKVRETYGQPVVDAFIIVGFGPWKREFRAFINGGQWIARASAKPRK